MKTRIPLGVVLAALLVMALGLGVWKTHAQSPAKRYVCAPCNLDCDQLVFDHPGTCPKCGMALVDAASLPATRTQPKVAILIFDGVQVIDFTGPYEIFQAA